VEERAEARKIAKDLERKEMFALKANDLKLIKSERLNDLKWIESAMNGLSSCLQEQSMQLQVEMLCFFQQQQQPK
jgi:hypothetical protein